MFFNVSNPRFYTFTKQNFLYKFFEENKFKQATENNNIIFAKQHELFH